MVCRACSAIWIVAFVITTGSVTRAEDSLDVRRPNILLIMADDLGFSDVGCYGGEIRTPHLDQLAADGIRFTQFYNCAQCHPTRASLLTGLYPQQVDGERSVTIAQLLQKSGYRTLMTGKWHGIGRPIPFGFDRFYGLLSGSCNFFNPGNRRPGEPEPAKDFGVVRTFAVDDVIVKPYTPTEKNWYATDAFTERALDFLDQYSTEGNSAPFFLYVAYTAPHHPLQAPEEEIAKYRGRYQMGWDVLREQRWRRQQELGVAEHNWKLTERDPEAPTWESIDNKEEWDLLMAVYAGMVDRLDQNIGRLLAKLRELNVDDNTVILFLSDNGACAEINNQTPEIPPGPMDSYRTYDVPWANVGDTPFRKFKRWTHEGGICTPLIVRMPGNDDLRGTFCRAPGHVIDLLPTLCELAGTEYPEQWNGQELWACEGHSLLPLFRGEPRRPHAILCWERYGKKGVRIGNWKLAGEGDPAEPVNWELFDLNVDRTETNDLSSRHPKRVRDMAQEWIHWAQRTGLKWADESSPH